MSKASKNKLFEQIVDMSNKIYEKQVGRDNYIMLINPTKPFTKRILALTAKKERKLRNIAHRKMMWDSIEDAHNWYCPECIEWCAPFSKNWKYNTLKKIWQHNHRAKIGWIDGKRQLPENKDQKL